MSFAKTISLTTGTLAIQINESPALFDQYIDFAARNNPKRGFLFISKVLGKHYPCKPAAMLQSYAALADLLLAAEQDAQRLLFIGMAETATALGMGVYQNWLGKTQKQGIYCQTTRYFLAEQAFVDFQEAHTHAKDFYLYIPGQPDIKQSFSNADTLVLIDDEISTGNTFANLVNAYKKLNPHLQRVIIVSLLNLSLPAARANVAQRIELPVTWLSLLSGQFSFTPKPEFNFQLSNANSNSVCKKNLLALNYGRLGLQGQLTPIDWQLNQLTAGWNTDAKVLVLGTGEFIYPAYLLATELDRLGFDVYVQSTTRSPILLGHGIHDCLSFQDNYNDGISNYLYNRSMNEYEQIIVCHETPKNAEITALLALLNATPIQVVNGTVCISRS